VGENKVKLVPGKGGVGGGGGGGGLQNGWEGGEKVHWVIGPSTVKKRKAD